MHPSLNRQFPIAVMIFFLFLFYRLRAKFRVCSELNLGSGYFDVDGNLPLESILP